MTNTTFTPPAACCAPRSRRPLFHLISLAFCVQNSRRALARLDRATLADLGLSPEDAAREAARPLWDVPASWRR